LNKYIYIVILLLIVCCIPFILPQGSAQVATKHYQNGEISFDYPSNWQELKTQNSQVAVFRDPDTGYNITINRQMIQPNYTPNKNFIITPPNGVQNDFKPTSTETNKISGVDAYINTYNVKFNKTSITQRELWLQKNNALYSVIYKSNQDAGSILSFLGNSKSEFDIIKNSFKVEQSSPTKSPVFASVSIPKLNVNWNIHSDTVNAYNGVYHYKESFYAGKSGSFGLLGHHTTYSAPFNHLETLQKGDKVVINDYLTQKKYIYSVVSNNDIRYDYKTNKIMFYPDNRELILGTCWPPGSTAAEIYVHCQLDSVEPL
jgi:sortase A